MAGGEEEHDANIYSEEDLRLIEDTEDAMRPLWKRPCPDCDGSGFTKDVSNMGYFERRAWFCEGCGGTGKLVSNEKEVEKVLPKNFDMDDFRFFRQLMPKAEK